MSITIDQGLCSGCGICVDLCPEIFGWGADNKAIVIKQERENSNIEEVADQCPTEAIEV